MFFDDNFVGVDDEKEILHDKRWGVYMNDKKLLIQCGYSVEVSGFDGKKFIYEVLNDKVLEEVK